MKQMRRYYPALAAVAFLLSGCGQKDAVYDYGPEKMTAMIEQIPDERLQAPSFASALCVIMGDEPEPDSTVTAKAAGVFSLKDGEVLIQKNPYERMNPASITKIMTALIAVRDGDLEESVTVGQETVITEPGASLCHIAPGDTLTMEQLLYGLMLPSGNDAGAAIAVHMAGSIEAFAEEMNKTAHQLGAVDTHFTNPHGLTDENHYTTAYDLYLIFQEAMKYPEFQKIVGTVSYTATYTDGSGAVKMQKWENSNRYLSGNVAAPEGVTVLGGKTGTTQAAGSCLILGCQDDSESQYVAVILKAKNRGTLYENMTNIIQKIVN